MILRCWCDTEVDLRQRQLNLQIQCVFCSQSSYLPVLEVLQADSTDGAGVGAAGRPPGGTVALRARAALGAVGFGLQTTDGPHGLLMDRVLHTQEVCQKNLQKVP